MLPVYKKHIYKRQKAKTESLTTLFSCSVFNSLNNIFVLLLQKVSPTPYLVMVSSKQTPVLEYFCQLVQPAVVEVQDLVLALPAGDHDLARRVVRVIVEHAQGSHLT